MNRYSKEVNSLLRLGGAEINEPWPDYVKRFSLRKRHVPELLGLIKSVELERVCSACSTEEAAAMHAWRALGQLRASEALESLLDLLVAPENAEAFWYRIELPQVIGLMGPSAVAPVRQVLRSAEVWWAFKCVMMESLVAIVIRYPDVREEAITAMLEQLEGYKENDPAFNDRIVQELSRLEASEGADLVRQVVLEDALAFDFLSVDELEKIIG